VLQRNCRVKTNRRTSKTAVCPTHVTYRCVPHTWRTGVSHTRDVLVSHTRDVLVCPTYVTYQCVPHTWRIGVSHTRDVSVCPTHVKYRCVPHTWRIGVPHTWRIKVICDSFIRKTWTFSAKSEFFTHKASCLPIMVFKYAYGCKHLYQVVCVKVRSISLYGVLLVPNGYTRHHHGLPPNYK
jgi:hypothetical protein